MPAQVPRSHFLFLALLEVKVARARRRSEELWSRRAERQARALHALLIKSWENAQLGGAALNPTPHSSWFVGWD